MNPELSADDLRLLRRFRARTVVVEPTSDPRLPAFLRAAGYVITDDTGNIWEIMSPEGGKWMVYKHALAAAGVEVEGA